MKLAYIALQIALVGAGILVYDQLRDPAPAPLVDDDPLPIETSELPLQPPPQAPPVRLQGDGLDGVERRFESLEARQRELEQSLEARLQAIADSGPAYTPANVPSASDPERPEVYDPEEPGAPRFSRQDVDWFRAVKKEADRIERHERHVQMIHRQIDRLELSLSDEQRSSLTDATISYRDKVRETVTKSAQAGESREQRQAALEVLRSEYQSTVRNMVPSGDADQIIERMGRYPGYGYRRGGSSRFGPR